MTALAFVSVGAVDITDPKYIWDGNIEDFKAYNDTKTIYIYTPGQFIALHHKAEDFENGHHSYDDWTIYLMNDIDLNNNNIQPWTIGWTDSHRFAGRFDGQGHTIKNIYIDGGVDNRGLFGWICGGDIVNLRLENVTIVAGDGGNEHVGALCGRMDNHSLISHCAVVNCTVKAMDVNDGDEIGTFCGYVANDCNEIEYCYTDGSVEGRSQIGGIVGKMESGGDGSKVHHCYFTGKVIGHHEDYRYIVGEINGQKVANCFYLNHDDGVDGGGGTACTEEELKAPMLFGADDAEWVYPLNGYPELKVFLRYNPGDSFYTTNVGHIDNYEAIDLPGYLSVRSKTEVERMKNVEGDIIKWTEVTSANVVLEKVIGAAAYDDFIVNSNQQSYFSPIPLTNTALGANAFEKLRAVNGVSLPETIDSIAYPQRHNVQQAIVLSNDLSGCAMKDNALYDMNRRLLLTAIKSPTTLTIHQEYADSIADYAFENMTGLKKLYVDTWVEAGREVDDGENRPPVLKLKGEHAFDGCPEDLDIFIKDGTQDQLFLGYQATGGYGYSNADYWNLFYSDYQDVPNHMFTYFPVNRNPGGMSTLMLGYPVELPEGVTAWWAQSLGDNNVTLEKLGTQIVPPFTPVLLTYKETGPLYLSRYTGDNYGAATDYENNLFKGSVDPGGHTMTDSEMMSNFLTLGRPNGDNTYDNLGFYLYHPKNKVLPSYIAWIASSDLPAEARLFANFGDGTTKINPYTVKSSLTDEIRVYTMQGIRIDPSSMRKGIMYIVNGKKVII
jgi:hypothetical protein